MTVWWCEHALVGTRLERMVSIDVVDGKIAAIEVNVSPPPNAVRLAGVTIPGFANVHSHAFHRALRSRVQAERGSFWTWREVMYQAAEQLDPNNYHALARAVFAEMVLAGMTVVGEFHYIHHQPDGTPYDNPNAMGEAVLAAAADAGLRITLLDTCYQHGGLGADGYTPAEGTQRRFSDRDVETWVARVDALHGSPTAKIGAAVHSVRAVSPESMRTIASWTRTTNSPLHAHVSEQRSENEMAAAWLGSTPTGILSEAGALGEHFTAVHATHLDQHDLELLGTSGSNVCLCPTTERDLGDGIGPSADLSSHGARLCLGSDSHAVIDHTREARAVEMNARLRSESRGVHTAAELVHMATAAGHRSLGWDDAGELAVGQRADLVTIDLDGVRVAGAPSDLLLEATMFAATASDIVSVVVDGEQVVSNGAHRSIDAAGELGTAIEELFA